MLKPNRADGDNALQAGVQLALHFGRWVDATQAGEAPPAPDSTRAGSVEDVANALGQIADHLGLGGVEQRSALAHLLAGFADMIGTQGAELEGVLHTILRPAEGPRSAMVLRIHAPRAADKPH